MIIKRIYHFLFIWFILFVLFLTLKIVPYINYLFIYLNAETLHIVPQFSPSFSIIKQYISYIGLHYFSITWLYEIFSTLCIAFLFSIPLILALEKGVIIEDPILAKRKMAKIAVYTALIMFSLSIIYSIFIFGALLVRGCQGEECLGWAFGISYLGSALLFLLITILLTSIMYKILLIKHRLKIIAPILLVLILVIDTIVIAATCPIVTEKDKCFRIKAVKIGDPNICNRIKGDSTGQWLARMSCIDAVVTSQAISKKDVSFCKQDTVPYFVTNECYAEYALKTQDIKVCEKINETEEADNCYTEIALSSKDVSICEKVSVWEGRKKCYTKIFTSGVDSSICERTKPYRTRPGYKNISSEGKDMCNFHAALALGDIEICEKINDREWKLGCRDSFR